MGEREGGKKVGKRSRKKVGKRKEKEVGEPVGLVKSTYYLLHNKAPQNRVKIAITTTPNSLSSNQFFAGRKQKKYMKEKCNQAMTG